MGSEAQSDKIRPVKAASGSGGGAALLGGLYSLLGPALVVLTVGYTVLNFGTRLSDAPAWAIGLLILGLPAIAPIALALNAADPSGTLPLDQRGLELVCLCVGNVFLWAALGLFIGRAIRLRRILRGEIRHPFRPVAVLFLLALALLAGTPCVAYWPNQMLAGRIAEQKQKKGDLAHRDDTVTAILNDTILVSVEGGDKFTLHKPDTGFFKGPLFGEETSWTFEGRQNRLAGSRIVRLRYSGHPQSIELTVTVEGTLFESDKVYSLSGSGQLEKGTYYLKDQTGGSKLRVEICEPLRYERRALGGMFNIEIDPF